MSGQNRPNRILPRPHSADHKLVSAQEYNMVLGLGLFSDTFHNTSTPLWFGFGWSLLLLSRESVWLRVGGVVFHGVVFFGNYGVLVFT